MARAHRRRTFNMEGLGIDPAADPGAVPPGIFDTMGATLWEWLHPEQVRAEYEMQMKTPPPDVQFGDVIGAGIEDARDVAREAGANISAGVAAMTKGAKQAAVALVIVVIAYAIWKARGK